MATPTAPDLTNVILPFDPVSFWVAGDYDAAALVEALKAQKPLANFADEDGDIQSGVRLDLDADQEQNVGYWVTVPKGTAQSVIDAGVAAYAPPGPPPTPDPFVPASVAVQTAVAAAMATVGITSPGLTAAQKQSIQTQVQQQVQAVVDAHLETTG